LLQDPTVNDILVNGPKQVYVERAGVLEESNVMFKDNCAPDEHHRQDCVGNRKACGRVIADGRCPFAADGSRVNVIIPPLAIDGPHISIRRFGHIPITEDDFVEEPNINATYAGIGSRSS
jgi:pilus assembly protein CpaF